MTKFINRSKADARIICSVHDSIVMEVKEGLEQDIIEEVNNIAKYDIPKYFPWLQVPMVFDHGIGASWGDVE